MKEGCDVSTPAAHLEREHDDVEDAAYECDRQSDERHDAPDDERDGIARNTHGGGVEEVGGERGEGVRGENEEFEEDE